MKALYKEFLEFAEVATSRRDCGLFLVEFTVVQDCIDTECGAVQMKSDHPFLRRLLLVVTDRVVSYDSREKFLSARKNSGPASSNIRQK